MMIVWHARFSHSDATHMHMHQILKVDSVFGDVHVVCDGFWWVLVGF